MSPQSLVSQSCATFRAPPNLSPPPLSPVSPSPAAQAWRSSLPQAYARLEHQRQRLEDFVRAANAAVPTEVDVDLRASYQSAQRALAMMNQPLSDPTPLWRTALTDSEVRHRAEPSMVLPPLSAWPNPPSVLHTRNLDVVLEQPRGAAIMPLPAHDYNPHTYYFYYYYQFLFQTTLPGQAPKLPPPPAFISNPQPGTGGATTTSLQASSLSSNGSGAALTTVAAAPAPKLTSGNSAKRSQASASSSEDSAVAASAVATSAARTHAESVPPTTDAISNSFNLSAHAQSQLRSRRVVIEDTDPCSPNNGLVLLLDKVADLQRLQYEMALAAGEVAGPATTSVIRKSQECRGKGGRLALSWL